MSYDKKPEMILFDVGGTLFDDGKCIPRDGLSALLGYADNPELTDADALAALWDEYMDEVDVGLRSKNGHQLDIPLSAILRYITMKAGLHFSIPMPRQEEIFDRFNSTRKITPGLTALLETLGKTGIRTAVISNNGMSGESLSLAVKEWLPSSDFEFCLTSADILLAKPDSSLFQAAAAFSGLETKDCWYCGDNIIPDVYGAVNSGMTPVLLDTKGELSCEYRSDGSVRYMTVKSWYVLDEYIKNNFGKGKE